MLKKISLENFMAHEATSLELAPGVTVLTGPNNIGKSAIVEALRYLLYNPPPKHVIRHGAREAVVRLELDSGEIITWRRQGSRAAYSLQAPDRPPEEYYKFGREVPEDIRTLLRLDQVVTDTGEKIDIHLGNQREPIFLLDKPGSHAAGFFAASTEADYLLKMQQALKRRREDAKREQSRLQAELAALADSLARLEPLADLDLLLQQAEALYAIIAATLRQLPVWQDLWSDLTATTARLQVAQSSAAVLADLQAPPALKPIAGLVQILEDLENTSHQMAQENLRQVVLADLPQPPLLAATAALAETAQAMHRTQTELTVAQAQESVLAALQEPPAALPTQELAATIAGLTAAAQQWQAEANRLAALAAMQPPPPLTVVGILPQLIRELAETERHLAQAWQRQDVLAQAASPPDLFDQQPLTSILKELAALMEPYRWQQQGLQILASLATPPELLEVAHLEEILGHLSRGAADLEREEQRRQRLSQELAQQRAQIADYLQAVGACPLCGSPLDLEHFLEERHG